MILSTIVILLALGIAFIHYIQGFFSATISAILIVLSACIAMGYQETVTNLLKPGKFADSASAGILCLLFVVTYVILRVIFDKLIPGNVRLSATVDKVGAGVMGLIAGVFATGVIAIAAESMPFDPGSLYARYAQVGEREAGGTYDPNKAQMDRKLYDQMKSATFDPKDLTTLIVPTDDWVVSTVKGLSAGSLSTQNKFADVHPDYLQELFGQRTGIQPGVKHTATNFPGGASQVSVEHVYLMTTPPPIQDAEIEAVRKADKEGLDSLKPQKGTPILVVRAKVSADAADTANNIFSFSMGGVRLVVHPEDAAAKDLYPIGTVEAGKLWMNRIDDYQFADAHSDVAIDFAFPLDEDTQKAILDVQVDPKTKRQAFSIKDGTFVEVKRFGRVDLSNKPVEQVIVPPPSKEPGVLRKMIYQPKKS